MSTPHMAKRFAVDIATRTFMLSVSPASMANLTANCQQLAARLQRLQNLLQHVHDPDAQAQIAEEIAAVLEEQKNAGCLASSAPAPWAILLCKFKDNQTEPENLDTPFKVPNFRRDCERFFTSKDAGFNAVRYFADMSHGWLDLSNSQIFGWFVLDVNTTDGKSQNDMMTLAKVAARKGGVNLDNFFGVVLIMNIPTGAAQGGHSQEVDPM